MYSCLHSMGGFSPRPTELRAAPRGIRGSLEAKGFCVKWTLGGFFHLRGEMAKTPSGKPTEWPKHSLWSCHMKGADMTPSKGCLSPPVFSWTFTRSNALYRRSAIRVQRVCRQKSKQGDHTVAVRGGSFRHPGRRNQSFYQMMHLFARWRAAALWAFVFSIFGCHRRSKEETWNGGKLLFDKNKYINWCFLFLLRLSFL